MKNFFFLLIVISNIHLSCKCGCELVPVSAKTCCDVSSFNLVVKNAAGEDLLNPKTIGSYKTDEIKLYNQKADGTRKTISFTINQPKIGQNYKLDYFQLNSIKILPSYGNRDVTYLQFRDETPCMVEISSSGNYLIELSINREKIERDEKLKEYINALFYFTKK
jgi:hypothetical protein